MSAFENEVFEDTDKVPEPSEALGNSEPVVFNRAKATPRVGPKDRVKRTEVQMIASLGGSALKEANYVTNRVQKLEDKISELLGSVSQKARELILADHPHLSRY